MKEEICSVLVTSCDSYDDTWEPFFTLLETMWPNCHYPIYLSTETKNFSLERERERERERESSGRLFASKTPIWQKRTGN